MKKETKTEQKDTNRLHQKRYRENEILSVCSSCNCERLLAYWDAELEHYIYLSDEPVLCAGCQALALTSVCKADAARDVKHLRV